MLRYSRSKKLAKELSMDINWLFPKQKDFLLALINGKPYIFLLRRFDGFGISFPLRSWAKARSIVNFRTSGPSPYCTAGQMGKGYRVSSFLSWRVNSHPRITQRVPSESPTQELSDGTLNPDLGLNTASAEAKNMKKWTFFKWSWSKGQLTFEGQLWPKGSLWLGLQFDV